MDKRQKDILKELVYEYGDSMVIEDGEIVGKGSLITSVVWNEDTDEPEFYAGDMETDKYAERIFPNEDEFNEIFDYVVDNF